MVLAIDPSSTRTGYALLTCSEYLQEAGVLSPENRRDAPIERIRCMAGELIAMIELERPDVIVIEVPSGRIGTGFRRGAKARLSVYGLGAGGLWGVCWSAVRVSGHRIALVETTEREWTCGRSRAVRAQHASAAFPHIAPKLRGQDPGGDIADAIGIGLWWFNQQRLRSRVGA